MGFAACPGTCPPNLFDWIGYVIVGIGAVVVLSLTYLITRRIAGAHPHRRWFVPFAVGGVLIFLTVQLTLFVRSEIDRHTWPVVLVGSLGTTPYDRFYLSGRYAIDWRVQSGPSACHLAATLRFRETDEAAANLVDSDVPASASYGEETVFIDLPGRFEYYVDADTDCASWSIHLWPEARWPTQP